MNLCLEGLGRVSTVIHISNTSSKELLRSLAAQEYKIRTTCYLSSLHSDDYEADILAAVVVFGAESE